MLKSKNIRKIEQPILSHFQPRCFGVNTGHVPHMELFYHPGELLKQAF